MREILSLSTIPRIKVSFGCGGGEATIDDGAGGYCLRETMLHTVKLLELLVHRSLGVELLSDGHVGATGDLGL